MSLWAFVCGKSRKFGIRIGLKSSHEPASLRTVASALRQQLIADKSKFLGIRRPRVDVDGALPAKNLRQNFDRTGYSLAYSILRHRNYAKLNVSFDIVPGSALGKGQKDQPLAVGRSSIKGGWS